ncbi:hypothetical protein SAMN05216228_10052 [Rhizobium tibeticum]|uniref:Glyoxalase-like domain protein n=1 Tax=Rhizobium tibeticum TaxID=501024 RepID=A0ABY1AHX1_9HYPH|nr:hypothetical protein SAMN05216228_10052 [Rhizobium tibeticum]
MDKTPPSTPKINYFPSFEEFSDGLLEFGVIKPFDGQPATVGNGGMVAFEARSRAQVKEVHAAALALGGQDEGAPGPRGENGADPYCAYFRDPEGNKFLVYRAGPDES